MSVHRWLVLALTLLLPQVAPAADSLPAPLETALRASGLGEAQVGLVVQEIGNPTALLSFGETRAFNPASVMKLLTTLAALDSLGPARTFKTRVLAAGSLADGVLHGDLILQGGGDPALSLERFWSLLRAIRAQGIREIRGDLLIDNTYYDIPPADPGAFDQAPLKPYNAPPAALLVNYNALPLSLSARSDGVSASLDPPVVALDNRLALSRDRACNGWEEGLALSPGTERLVLDGSYALDCGERVAWLNLLPPQATVAALFVAYWRELGGRLDGQARAGNAPTEARLILEQESPPLSLSIRDINKYSNNVMAKMLFLNLGAERFGAPATWEKGERAVRAWLAAKGLDLPELILENGSGLSRNERISVAGMARLLQWAAGQPLYYEFAASLPALGLEGTQKRRLGNTPLAGRGWLKTGTLNGTRASAGYVLDSLGKRKVVVIFISQARPADAERFQAEILHWAIGQPMPTGAARTTP